MSNGTNSTQQDTTGQGRTQADAQEFGQHVRQGGWRLGLLVARNVEIGEAGRPSMENRNNRSNSKVSGNEFARLSGVSRPKVLRYLAAWNLAAEQGVVPPASDLTPGTNVDLDVDTLPAWSQFYEAKNTSTRQPEPIKPSIEAVTEAVKSNPDYAKAISEHVEPTPEQVTKAIRSNPEIEKAARDEAWNMTREKIRAESDTPPRQDKDIPKDRSVRDERADVVALASKIRTARIALDDALEIAARVDGAAIAGLTDSIRVRCDLLDAALGAETFDTQLTALLESEAGR